MRSQQTMKKQKNKKIAAQTPEGETEEGISSNTDCDQATAVSIMEDTDEDIDTTEIEEDWIEYLKISTKLAEEKIRTANIPRWITTHKKMLWKLAMSLFLTKDEMVKKAATWNPGFRSGCKASRAVERLRERW